MAWSPPARQRRALVVESQPETTSPHFQPHPGRDHAFLAPHAERHEAEEMLRQMLLTVRLLNDEPVVKAFFGKIGPGDDKVLSIRTNGLQVYIELENRPYKIYHRVFVNGFGFKMPK
jgi:hypothetical protein